MNGEVYWYFLNGHLKEHLNPPSDPSSVTFATIRTTDIGYKQVRAEIIVCVEGHYMKPKIFISEQYATPKQFRDYIEKYVKSILTAQRQITDWTGSTQQRKTIKKNVKPARKCKCK